MVVVIDEGLDLCLVVTGQKVVLKQDAALQGLVPPLDLVLCLGLLTAFSPQQSELGPRRPFLALYMCFFCVPLLVLDGDVARFDICGHNDALWVTVAPAPGQPGTWRTSQPNGTVHRSANQIVSYDYIIWLQTISVRERIQTSFGALDHTVLQFQVCILAILVALLGGTPLTARVIRVIMRDTASFPRWKVSMGIFKTWKQPRGNTPGR